MLLSNKGVEGASHSVSLEKCPISAAHFGRGSYTFPAPSVERRGAPLLKATLPRAEKEQFLKQVLPLVKVWGLRGFFPRHTDRWATRERLFRGKKGISLLVSLGYLSVVGAFFVRLFLPEK